jgi:hypothetical protein
MQEAPAGAFETSLKLSCVTTMVRGTATAGTGTALWATDTSPSSTTRRHGQHGRPGRTHAARHRAVAHHTPRRRANQFDTLRKPIEGLLATAFEPDGYTDAEIARYLCIPTDAAGGHEQIPKPRGEHQADDGRWETVHDGEAW